MTNEFVKVLQNRRTYYQLSKDITVSPARIQEIVESVILATPSAFNSQTQRVVLLFGQHHNTLWQLTHDILKAIVPAENFSQTAEKIAGFAAAAGSILYFEDMDIVKDLQTRFPLYAEAFPIFSTQANAMLQSNIWNALEAEGLGASLQHYNPLIDDKVKETWQLPPGWRLIAQMPFGKIAGPPDEKQVQPASERIKVLL